MLFIILSVLAKSHGYTFLYRREFNQILEIVQHESSSCTSSSSEKDDLDLLLLEFAFAPKLLLQPVGKYYFVASILINCHIVLYGSLTGTYFGVDTPSLETYLSNHLF